MFGRDVCPTSPLWVGAVDLGVHVDFLRTCSRIEADATTACCWS